MVGVEACHVSGASRASPARGRKADVELEESKLFIWRRRGFVMSTEYLGLGLVRANAGSGRVPGT